MRYLALFVTTLTLHAAPARQAAPVAGRLPDAQIEQNIRANYAKSKISVDHFTVHVKGGTATIEGKTDIIQRKGWATRYAKLGGATAVVNNIQVSEAAKQRARAKLTAARQSRKAHPAAQTAVAKSTPKPSTQVAAKPGATPPTTVAEAPPAIRKAQIKH